MPPVFRYLSASILLLLLITAGLGFFDPAATPDRHVLLAVLTLLLSCGVQVLAFTYLTVTGKVIAQAIHLGGLDLAALDEAKAIKRSLARTLGALVLMMVAATASGAAAWRSGDPHTYHLSAAFLLLAAHAWALFREYGLIARNALLLDRTLRDYEQRKRQARR